MNDRVHVMRQSIVKLTQMLAGRGISVTQQGISAYVRSDEKGRPVVVNLPFIPDNATEELIQAIQGFLDHEVAHILFTDFTLMAEAMQHDAGSMLNLLEDTRIERCMSERFEGSAYNLSVTGKFFLDKYTTPKMNEAIASGNNDLMIAVLTVPLVRAMSGQQIFKEFMKDHMGTIAPVYDKIKDLEGQIQKLGSTADCLTLAKEIVTRLRDGKPSEGGGSGKGKSKSSSGGKAAKGTAAASKGKGEGEGEEGTTKAKKAPKSKPEKKEKEEGAGSEKGEAEKEEKPAPAEGSDAEPPASEEGGEEEAPTEEGGADGEDTAGDVQNSDEEAEDDDSLMPPVADDDADAADSDEPIDTSRLSAASWKAIDKETKNDFDETVSKAITDGAAKAAESSEYLIFTTDKDVIEPLKIGRDYEDRMLVNLQNQVDHMVGPLQKDLERAISARSLSVYSTGHRSGRLHPANLSRLAINGPNGPDTRVFRRKHEATSKDVAVELVVDFSGSMNGSKIHTAVQSAYALCSTLERIGIKSEAIAFTTGEVSAPYNEIEAEAKKIGKRFSRIESLYMPILKGFDERMTTEVKKRFGWMPHSSSMASNVDGESIMVAARRLLARRETGKVMIVLSDGYPAASGGSGVLKPHLKKTVRDIEKAGVNVVGIGIESEAVQEFYRKFVILRSVTELPSLVMKELRALIVK